jgi:MFS family permease
MKVATPPQNKSAMQPTRGQARFAFTILLIINILNYADRYVLPAILSKIQASPQAGGLGLTDFEAGAIGSSFLIVYAIATLPIGVWADKGIRKNIVAICVGIWSVATVLAGITRNFVQLFVVRSILGIGEAGYAPASLSLLGDYFPKESRGRILSYWSAGTLIGSAVGFTIGGLIADTLGWRWAFYVVGLPGLIAAFLIWRATEPQRGVFDKAEQDNGTEESSIASAHGSIGADFWTATKQLLRIPTYWMLLGALTFSFFTIGGSSFWLATYVVRTFHLSAGSAGTLSGVVLVVGGLIGTVVGGLLADFMQRRRPEGRMLVATIGFLLGAPVILLALFIHDLPLFVTTFIIGAVFLSFCTGPLNAVIQDVIRPDLRATAVGFSLLFAHILGDASSPSLIGLIADRTHSLNFALLTTAPTALFIAGLICLIGLRTVASDMKIMEAQLQQKRSVEG